MREYMNILDRILELDFALLENFTKRLDTPWGILFCNEGQPDYYDANHAHIRNVVKDPTSIIHEVVNFYETKNIIPRFYIHEIDNHAPFITQLKAFGFKFEELVHPVQIWNNKAFVSSINSDVTIERVTEENFHEALYVECNIKEIGGSIREKALKDEFSHTAYEHYLLRYKGTACSTACIFQFGSQARMESVATIEGFRGKGLIGYLIGHIQSVVTRKGYENLWVFPINERVEKVYARYGFVTLEKLKTGHAFLGGKSIKEIQEG